KRLCRAVKRLRRTAWLEHRPPQEPRHERWLRWPPGARSDQRRPRSAHHAIAEPQIAVWTVGRQPRVLRREKRSRSRMALPEVPQQIAYRCAISLRLRPDEPATP